MNNKLYLHFYPKFPALDPKGEPIGGQLIELDPHKKGGKREDSFWLLGKTNYCDIRFLPPKDPTLKVHYGSISRIHLTVKFEVKTKIWAVLDGGVYLNEGDTNPGEETITPSLNGVWISGDRIRVYDWCAIGAGDRIHFGNDKRIVIYTSPDPTLNDEIWNDENWIYNRGEKQGIEQAANDANKLLKHAQENATPQKSNDSLWSVLGKIFDWLSSPSKTKWEQFMKLTVAGSGIALALSTEFRVIIENIFDIFLK